MKRIIDIKPIAGVLTEALLREIAHMLNKGYEILDFQTTWGNHVRGERPLITAVIVLYE